MSCISRVEKKDSVEGRAIGQYLVQNRYEEMVVVNAFHGIVTDNRDARDDKTRRNDRAA